MQKTKPVLLLDFDFTLCDSSTRENAYTHNDTLNLANYLQDTAQHDKGLPLLCYILRNKRAIEYKYNILILTNRDFNRKCGSKIVHLVSTNFVCFHRGILAAEYGDNFKAILLDRITRENKAVLFIDDEPKFLDIARQNKARAICARDLWHYKPHEFTALFFG